MLVPDSAHGTNPASAAMVGYEVRQIASGPDGMVDLSALEAALDDRCAGLMLTNPNTWACSKRTSRALLSSFMAPEASCTMMVPTSTPS